MRIFLLVSLVFSILLPSAYAGKDVTKYQVPNVKDDYCGVSINYQYCRCAFHNEDCNAIGLSRGASHSYVLEQFRAWNKDRIQRMGASCIADAGYWNTAGWSCIKCTDGDVLEGSRCVSPEKSNTEARECNEALKNFDNEWEKYSDFDDRLGSDVSYEVQQFNQELNDVADLIGLAHEIEYEMAIMAEVRLEMRAYKAALVQNIKVNLLKSFWRLSYISYSTIKSGWGMKGSVEKILDPENTVQAVGAGLKLVQSVIPPYEDAKGLQIDTSTTIGKIKSMTWNATLEAMESVGKTSDIATQVMKDARAAVLPSPDITPEEVAILRDQHLSNHAIDEALADSYAESAALRDVLLETKKLIAEKYNLMQTWKLKEYQRVKGNLEDQCKEKE